MRYLNVKMNRPGFTLVELLCVLALFALASMMLTLVILGTLEIERTQAEGFDRLLQNKALAEQFRADVSAAVAAPAQWEQFNAGEHRVILQLKSGDHVIYVWRDKVLRRQLFGDQESSEVTLPIDARNVSVEFVTAQSETKLIRLRLHTLQKGKRADGQSLEIAAALGGDWR